MLNSGESLASVTHEVRQGNFICLLCASNILLACVIQGNWFIFFFSVSISYIYIRVCVCV